jgi:CDGSH-type Zn-finger protein
MKAKIKIVAKGPYLVTGGVPLSEKIIESKGNGYVYREGRELPQAEAYALCRCGKTTTPPFCDGSHTACRFIGEETAPSEPFTDRAELLRGPALDMYDDGRCAFARFCHRENGDAWELLNRSDRAADRREAIAAASECPAGRLVAVTKAGQLIEPALTPSIDILQDPERNVSCGIYVKGYIPVESAKGFTYEPRNRVVLCRCGASRIKPFCDASHVDIGYKDLK